MEIRFQFKRGAELKFIGHLDILRLFERAFKRAGLPVTHSEGFNPRPRLIFGQPMPLGLTSDGEFADVGLTEPVDMKAFMDRLNEALPPGIRILDARRKTQASNLMGVIDAARYRIAFETEEALDMQWVIDCVFSSDSIPVMKKTKRGMRQINIRPWIYELEGDMAGHNGSFTVLLGAGQDHNVRPELFLEGVSQVIDRELSMRSMHRVMLYHHRDNPSVFVPEENQWISPMQDILL